MFECMLIKFQVEILPINHKFNVLMRGIFKMVAATHDHRFTATVLMKVSNVFFPSSVISI